MAKEKAKSIGEGLLGEGRQAYSGPVVQEGENPLLALEPGSELHAHVLTELKRRLEWSERRMAVFYPRWRENENRLQAYLIQDSDQEQEDSEAGGEGKAPEVYNIVVPYAYATISTICTYLMQTFAGREPIFALKSEKSETLQAARIMEGVLTHGHSHKNFPRHLWNFLWNGQVYGLSAFRTTWCRDMKKRTRWVGGERQRKLEVVFEGNESVSIDPFCFFPDPSVPMVEVGDRGNFCFWRSFEGKHELLREQADGNLHWVEYAKAFTANSQDGWSNSSNRAGGDSTTPGTKENLDRANSIVQVDQGTVWIIPKEMGLGESEYPELWLFSIANKSQIIQAEPFDADHGGHPVGVSEPYAFGQGFGNLGMSDFLGPIQDAMSWLINSHMDSVKEVLNSTFVVDPSRLEMQDFKKGKDKKGRTRAGRLLRLKSSAVGTDVRTALQQLAVQDVTQNHVQDMKVMQLLGDAISGVNDNLRGLQDSGGRKTATEVRVTGEAGASRLATLAKVISIQALKKVAEQQIYNIQQYMDESFYLMLTGKAGVESPLRVFPDMLVGDFHFKPHDGTLPLDKVATVEAWVQLISLIAGDQELRQNFDFVSLVEHVGDLAGAKGVEEFRINVDVMAPGMQPPQGAMPMGAQGGNAPPQGAQQGGQGVSPDMIGEALGASAGNAMGMGAGGPVS